MGIPRRNTQPARRSAPPPPRTTWGAARRGPRMRPGPAPAAPSRARRHAGRSRERGARRGAVGGAPRGPERRGKRGVKWRGTRREARIRPARRPAPPAPSPCLFSLSCRSNSSKSDMLRRPRKGPVQLWPRLAARPLRPIRLLPPLASATSGRRRRSAASYLIKPGPPAPPRPGSAPSPRPPAREVPLPPEPGSK